MSAEDAPIKFPDCTIDEYWLNQSLAGKDPGTLSVSHSGISWQSGGGGSPIQLITDYRVVLKIFTRKKKNKIKLCTQSADPKSVGVVLRFNGHEGPKNSIEAEKHIRANHTRACELIDVSSRSMPKVTSFQDVLSPQQPRASSANNALTTAVLIAPVSPRTRKFRQECLEKYEDIRKAYHVLVERQGVVTEEEFWRERKNELMIRRDEQDAQSNDTPVQDFDPGFSLRDIQKIKGKQYRITDRDIPKIFRLYPWLKKAYVAYVKNPDGKEVADFFHEFLQVIYDPVLLRRSKFQKFHENYISEESNSSKVASEATIEDVASEVPGNFNLLLTVGDKSNTLAKLGFGVHPKMVCNPRASNNSSSSDPSRYHRSTAQRHINKQSQQALHALLGNRITNKMCVYWNYQGEMWSPLTRINVPGFDEDEKQSASLFGLAHLVKLEAPPQKCNGLGLGAPPRRVIDYTSKLFDALTKTKTDLPRYATLFVEHFRDQFFDNEARGNEEAGVWGGNVNRISDSTAIQQHPDFHRSTLFEKDESRFAKRRTIDLSSMNQSKRQKLVGGFRVSEKDAAEFGLIEPTDCIYKEPAAIVSYQVFKSTMNRIDEHGDPFLVTGESGRAYHKIEEYKEVFLALVEKKQALAELLRLFWKAFDEKDRAKCLSMASRIRELETGLTDWKQSLDADIQIKQFAETFINNMRKQTVAVGERATKLQAARKKALARPKDA